MKTKALCIVLIISMLLLSACIGSPAPGDQTNGKEGSFTEDSKEEETSKDNSKESDSDLSLESAEESMQEEESAPEPRPLENVLERDYYKTLFAEQQQAYEEKTNPDSPDNCIRTVTFLGTTENAPESAVSLNEDGTVIGWYEEASSEYDWEKEEHAIADYVIEVNVLYDVYIAAEGGVMVENAKYFFFGYQHLREINFNGNFDTSYATNMYSFFKGCAGLMKVDLTGFNTSNVTTMADMFVNCNNLTSLDFSSFDTSNVTNMSYMFYGLGSEDHWVEHLDLSSFDTSNVTSMGWMFEDSYIKTIDLSSFNTSKVETMQEMFDYCHVTELDLSNFDTSNVTSMKYMFAGCTAQTLDLTNFDTSKVETMKEMFRSCTATSVIGLTIPEGCDTTDMYKGTNLN